MERLCKMRTISLRFAENFAPEEGTIAAHKAVIDSKGSVWWGKLGAPISQANAAAIMANDEPRILLIHSGGSDRWWAYIDEVKRERPDEDLIPSYYDRIGDKFGCWFHVKDIRPAAKDVMSHCTVPSSRRSLTSASRHSMSPYFVIDYEEG